MPVPSASDRVRRSTSSRINRRIHDETHRRLEERAGDPRSIPQRLDQLDREWDVERALEANAASLIVAGSLLAYAVDRRWAVLPFVVGSFLLQHAIQGWCPPLPVFRALGFRTPREIEDERHALKALRGDYQLSDTLRTRPDKVLEAVERA